MSKEGTDSRACLPGLFTVHAHFLPHQLLTSTELTHSLSLLTSSLTTSLRPCISRAAIRDTPPPTHRHRHRDLHLPAASACRSKLELSNNLERPTAARTSQLLRHKHKPPTPPPGLSPPSPHSRCHIAQTNQISISARSPCRIERSPNPIAAEVYHQQTRDWIEPKGSARLGFAKTKAAPLNTSPTTIPASQPC